MRSQHDMENDSTKTCRHILTRTMSMQNIMKNMAYRRWRCSVNRTMKSAGLMRRN